MPNASERINTAEVAASLRAESLALLQEAAALREQSKKLLVAARSIDGKAARRSQPIYAKHVVKERGLTYRELGELIGYSVKTIDSLFNGWAPASSRFLRSCEEALGVPAETLAKPYQP